MAFKNKGAELLELPKIFNQRSVTSSIPKELPNFEAPSVIYTLEKSIQSRMFNFNEFVLSFDIDAFMGEN